MSESNLSTVRLDRLPKEGFLRLSQVLQFIPISKSLFWIWVRDGKAPQPVKLGPKITAWKASDIQEFIDQLSADSQDAA